MNAGLGNLASLKNHLLVESLRARTTWDEMLETIGLTVAAQFERFTDRKFVRVAGEIEEHRADTGYIILHRYPIESISAIAQRESVNDGWSALTVNDVVVNRSDASGLVEFAGPLGTRLSRLKVTYTGGYWFDTTEDESGTQPAGSTAVPGDLKGAWLLQAQAMYQHMDHTTAATGGRSTITTRDKEAALQLADLALLPAVKEILAPYRRISLQ